MSTEKPENTTPAVSNAQQFKQRREERINGKTIELPSGLSVHCKRPDIQQLIADGHIPSEAASGLANTAQSGDVDMVEAMKVAKLVAIHSVTAPKVVDKGANYDDNEINVDDLEENDLAFILNFVQSGVDDLSLFRQ